MKNSIYTIYILAVLISCDFSPAEENPLLDLGKPFQFVDVNKLEVKMNYHIESHPDENGPKRYVPEEYELVKANDTYSFIATPLDYPDETPIIGDIIKKRHHTQYNFTFTSPNYIAFDTDSLVFEFDISIKHSNPLFGRLPENPGDYNYYTSYDYKRFMYKTIDDEEFKEIHEDEIKNHIVLGEQYLFKWEVGLKSGHNSWNRTFDTFLENEAEYTIKLSVNGFYK